jgi:hypothetical protein
MPKCQGCGPVIVENCQGELHVVVPSDPQRRACASAMRAFPVAAATLFDPTGLRSNQSHFH